MAQTVPLSSTRGRWILAVAILASGLAFLDGTVVNVALPAIGITLGGGIATQQWVLDGYLLTLSALLLPAGVASDRFGRRRVFLLGLLAFMGASIACGMAPTGAVLISARLTQGVGAAILVPGSLAVINSMIDAADRARAVGLWAGMSGVSTALGPFVGGWLVDAISWRWVFWMNIPLAVVAIWATARHLPPDGTAARTRFDLVGSGAIAVALAGVTYALIEGPAQEWSPFTVAIGVAGVASLAVFVWHTRRAADPLVAPEIFTSRQFAGVNLTTLFVYAALGGGMFLLALQLQQTLGYTALAAGAATVPMTVIMLIGSPLMGAVTQRIGARTPMTIGAIIAGAGVGLMALIAPGTGFLTLILPAVVVFGVGMTFLVTPLTTAMLASVPGEDAGAASGVNNAVSRVAGLLAVAALPATAGISAGPGEPLGPGYQVAMVVCAVGCVLGGLIAWVTVDRSGPVALGSGE